MSAEHENSLDVAGSARASYERDETWIAGTVFAFQESERRWQVWEELFAARENDMVRRKN